MGEQNGRHQDDQDSLDVRHGRRDHGRHDVAGLDGACGQPAARVRAANNFTLQISIFVVRRHLVSVGRRHRRAVQRIEHREVSLVRPLEERDAVHELDEPRRRLGVGVVAHVHGMDVRREVEEFEAVALAEDVEEEAAGEGDALAKQREVVERPRLGLVRRRAEEELHGGPHAMEGARAVGDRRGRRVCEPVALRPVRR